MIPISISNVQIKPVVHIGASIISTLNTPYEIIAISLEALENVILKLIFPQITSWHHQTYINILQIL